MMAALKDRRHWLRFSVHALLLLTTLTAVCAAWITKEFRRINLRRAARASIEARGGHVDSIADVAGQNYVIAFGLAGPVEIPWWRERLGDEPIVSVLLPYGSPEENIAAAQELFPEARVDVYKQRPGGGFF